MFKIILSIIFLITINSSNIPDKCILPDDTQFSGEINGLINAPFNYERFTEIKPNEKRCEYLKVSPFANYQTIYNFTCPEEICFRWCSYTTMCNFSLYSEKEKICTRSTGLELSDNFDKSSDYFSNEYITYRRNTAYLRYYSQRCNSYFGKKACNRDDQCAWNKGKPGYNREIIILGTNWCGRIKCLKN